MANNDTIWSNDSIINIGLDTPSSQIGTVNITGSSAQLGSLSSVEYTYNFASSGKVLRTNSLLIRCRASSSNNEMTTRYNENIAIELSINYWESNSDVESGYIEGNWSKIRVYPYLSSESEGYILDIPVDIDLNYINKIMIKIVTGDIDTSTITVSNLQIYWELSITEVIGEYAGTAQIKSVDTYDDGMVAYYIDDDMPVTLHVEEISTDNYLIDVSGRYNFPIVIHSGKMPWNRG